MLMVCHLFLLYMNLGGLVDFFIDWHYCVIEFEDVYHSCCIVGIVHRSCGIGKYFEVSLLIILVAYCELLIAAVL